MSGKQSKKIRKVKRFSKKAVIGSAAAILCTAPVVPEGGEFILSVFPHISFPIIKFDESLATGFGGGVALTYRPVEFFNVFAEGDYKQYRFNTKEDIGDISVIGGKVGVGYHLPITDRIGMDINAGVGYYNSTYDNGQGSSGSKTTVNGLSVTGSIAFSYKINPVFAVSAGGAVEHLAYKDGKFITSADVNPALSINLTKAFSNKANVSFDSANLKPVFPVFYSWYNDNPFGTIEISNHEDAAITDVQVSFYHPEYMGQPKNCGGTKILYRGETLTVDLKAFFNEQMLNLNEKNDSLTTITVEYKYLGSKRSATFPLIVPVYGRNNMSWEDDRCASAFVSSKDPAAMWFAKYVVSTIRDNVRNGLPTNIQYAMGIFEALDQFGINYVKDPTSAFEDNVGTASIDFLQFPYQTLMYRGGDCDDLSILVCSLFESIGIKTAFITVPGHIFMAFDSGFTVEQAKEYFINLDEFIVDGDNVWVPLEITLTDEGFNKAWHKGAWEWNVANRKGSAMLYKMEDSWKIYRPVNVPGATARFTLPEEQYVAKLFSHSVDQFVMEQIAPRIAYYENRIAAAPSAQNYNDLGVLYARYGLFELAEQQFRVAREKKYLPAYLNTANLYFSIKDYERAQNWYNEVLSKDDSVILATLGLARCSYELGDYTSCDTYYEQVYNTNHDLAKKYSYLGAFEDTTGRSFSLADRLENTIWINSLENEKTVHGVQNVQNQVAVQTTDVILKTPASEQKSPDLEINKQVAVVVPAAAEEKSEKIEKEEEPLTGGDGDDDANGENSEDTSDKNVTEVVEDTVAEEAVNETYVGIASELEFSFLTIDDLVALAEEKLEQPVQLEKTEFVEPAEVEVAEKSEVVEKTEVAEPTESFELAEQTEIAEQSIITEESAPVELAENSEERIEQTAEEETLVPQPETTAVAEIEEPVTDSEIIVAEPVEASVTSLITDVPLRAVPRFTTQPSEEWAPKEAYEVESIPGMKSFEEEMGVYQNEKAFLYKDEYDFAVNPGEKVEDKKDTEIAQNTVLEVNPFTSFLSEKEAAKVEAITKFKLENITEKVSEKITETVSDSVPETLPQVLSETVAQTVSETITESISENTAETVTNTTITSVEQIPVPEVIPEAEIATSEETAVAVPVVTETTVNEPNNKSKIPVIAATAGIAAAIAALFIAKKRKEK
ncbi:Protein of unknown function, DUF481 [Treponema bryantii]|uniref:Uncharacterized protein n=1 Tax=Treponema bryantii TaxID=163 RepID=A0A1H9FFQ8_9SPIR|nr:DUF481 domain-containing protein [Treponema bryantii]SEQ36801.1 Protein of unknown function, DUF481 [Treponema bryantii]